MSLPLTPRLRGFLAILAAAALTWGVATMVRLGAHSPWASGWRALVAYAGLFGLFLAGAWLVRSLPSRSAASVIFLGAVLLQVAAATAPPRNSDDLYRYVWDGRVQSAGIDPYRYVPASSSLASLRDSTLWPGTPTGWCVPAGVPGTAPGCTLINRPTVHTIYPPVAEAYFLAVHWLVPGGPSAIQGAAAFFAVAVGVGLWFGLRRLGRDPRLAVLWAWCPTVPLEAGNGGHVDVVAVLLTLGAVLLLARGRVLRGGIVLGLAVATKMTPGLMVPGVVRRRPVALLTSVFGTVALVYLPHVLAVGRGSLGFLGGYLQEEGYDSGRRFAVLAEVMPDSWTTPVAAVILVATAVWVWWRSTAWLDRPWHGALVMTGVAMLVAAPAYPWYAMLLVLFVALEGWRAVPWLAVAFAGYVVQASLGAGLGYGMAALVVGGWFGWGALRSAPITNPHPIRGQTTLNTESAAIQPPVKISKGNSTPSDQPIDVILPCLNEESALPYVLTRMPPNYRPIVVDNGSTDASAETARALGARVVHEPRRGFGAACHAGLLAATADIVCFLDCDGSFDPQDLPKVVGPVRTGDADLVLGRRRPLTRNAWPPHARAANRILAGRIRRTTGVRIRDLGPMRAARRESLLALDVGDRRFGYPLEMILKAAADGWRIAEVEVPYAPRTGRSKVTGTIGGTAKAVTDMRRVWKAATG